MRDHRAGCAARVAASPLLTPETMDLRSDDQRPQAADQHGADTEITNLRADQSILRGGLGARGAVETLASLADGGGQLRILGRGRYAWKIGIAMFHEMMLPASTTMPMLRPTM